MECCICHKDIEDCWPPLCDDEDCDKRFMVEVKFNKWAKEEVVKNENIVMQSKGA